MEKKTSEAQIKASRNWEKRNREKARYGSYKRTARLFVKSYAKEEDIQELIDIFNNRENKGIEEN